MSTRTNLNLCAATGALLLSMPAAAATFLFDDFSTGDDSQWERIDQTAEVCGKPGLYDASGNEYQMESACAIDDESDVILAARFAGGPDLFETDGKVRLKARHLNAETNTFISLRSWGSEGVGVWGYRFRVSGGGSMLSISRVWEHGTDTILAARLSASQLFQTGDEIYIEAAAIGERLSLKVWRAGQLEPEDANLVTRDHVFRDAGSVVIGVDHDGEAAPMGATFDDVMFATAVRGDANEDGATDFGDLLLILEDWGACGTCPTDLNGDHAVDFADVMIVLANWS